MKGRSLGEAVTAIGMILGLVFVGIEINRNTATAQAQSRQEIAAQNIDFLLRVVEDDRLAEIWASTWTSEYMAGLDDTSRTKAGMTAIALMIRLENVYLQFEQGLIEEEALPNYGMVQRRFEEPGFWEVWSDVRHTFDPRFREYFEALHEFLP
jgi:hypothetical protein